MMKTYFVLNGRLRLRLRLRKSRYILVLSGRVVGVIYELLLTADKAEDVRSADDGKR